MAPLIRNMTRKELVDLATRFNPFAGGYDRLSTEQLRRMAGRVRLNGIGKSDPEVDALIEREGDA